MCKWLPLLSPPIFIFFLMKDLLKNSFSYSRLQGATGGKKRHLALFCCDHRSSLQDFQHVQGTDCLHVTACKDLGKWQDTSKGLNFPPHISHFFQVFPAGCPGGTVAGERGARGDRKWRLQSLRGQDQEPVILKGTRISSLPENKVSYRTVANCVYTPNSPFSRVFQ